MKISDGRINYLSRQIATHLLKQGSVKGIEADPLSLEVKKGFNFLLQEEEKLEAKVRLKIASLKRGVPEGSSEWELLYRQYYNEEVDKL